MGAILQIAFYEIVHITKDKILFLLLFIAPVTYTTLFGLVYSAGIIKEVPLGIVDLDQSKLSQEVITAFSNTQSFKKVDQIVTLAQLEEGMKTGVVRAGIIIPEDFSQQIAEHRQAEIKVVYDASNLIWGYNIRKNALEVINQYSAQYTAGYLAGLGLTQPEILKVLNAVSCTSEIWFNPTYNYNNFLLMGLVMMIIHQLGLLSISLTVTREKERRSWLQYLSSPVSRSAIFWGKSLPYMIINFFNYALLLWLTVEFFTVKIEGSIVILIILGLLYSLIITAAGFCISVLAPNSLQATRYLMLLSVPFFMVAGYTWPDTHMPTFLNDLADLLPSTWMTNGFRQLTLKNLGWMELKPTLLTLMVMAAAAVSLAWRLAKQPYTKTPPVPERSFYS
ncbi:MAG: ABC transporter permease [Syntrophomonadaceae bacterium]|nr:ABC transporter permease [Syntrophomonadaceae bacterium]